MATTSIPPLLFPSAALRRKNNDSSRLRCRIRVKAMATERLGIKIEKNPTETRLAEVGVRSWPK